jgi:hypothetical protein
MLGKKKLITSAFFNFSAVEGSAIETFNPTDEVLRDIHDNYELIMYEVVYYESPGLFDEYIEPKSIERHDVYWNIFHNAELGIVNLNPLDSVHNFINDLDCYAINTMIGVRDIISNCNDGDITDRFYKAESESQLVLYAYCADIYNLPKEFIWQFIRKDKSEE